MRQQHNILPLLGIATVLSLMPTAQAGDWQSEVDVQGMYANYNGSSTRKDLSSEGLLFRSNYMDDWGIALGANATQLNFKSGIKLQQQAWYGSLSKKVYTDALPGALTIKLDGHWISNNDPTGDTSRVKVVAPQLSFLNYSKTLYMDMGYAYSIYPKSLKVSQITPTIGLGSNQAADWLQMRAYWIKVSGATVGKSNTSALEASWTHWLAPGAAWVPQSLGIKALLGERVYAVDGDAAAVYNLADLQKGSLSLSSDWRISDSVHILGVLGHEQYQNQLLKENYSSSYVFLDVKGAW